MATFIYKHEDYGDKMIITIEAKGVLEANVYIMAMVQVPSAWHLDEAEI